MQTGISSVFLYSQTFLQNDLIDVTLLQPTIPQDCRCSANELWPRSLRSDVSVEENWACLPERGGRVFRREGACLPPPGNADRAQRTAPSPHIGHGSVIGQGDVGHNSVTGTAALSTDSFPWVHRQHSNHVGSECRG